MIGLGRRDAAFDVSCKGGNSAKKGELHDVDHKTSTARKTLCFDHSMNIKRDDLGS